MNTQQIQLQLQLNKLIFTFLSDYSSEHLEVEACSPSDSFVHLCQTTKHQNPKSYDSAHLKPESHKIICLQPPSPNIFYR
jgi:hypothetical protein